MKINLNSNNKTNRVFLDKRTHVYKERVGFYNWNIVFLGPLGIVAALFLTMFLFMLSHPKLLNTFLVILVFVWVASTIVLGEISKILVSKVKNDSVFALSTLRKMSTFSVIFPLVSIGSTVMVLKTFVPKQIVFTIVNLAFLVYLLFITVSFGIFVVSRARSASATPEVLKMATR